MNIFFIDRCPIKSAQQLCDKHVVKMVLETAQMCSTAMHDWHSSPDTMVDYPTDLLKNIYKPAYQNHPMTKWVRDLNCNLVWAIRHGLAIGEEYKYRYDKDHNSTSILQKIKDYMEHMGWWIILEDNRHSKPPQCMPDEYKCDDYVEAYRNYYRKDKAHILKWTNREKPEWI